MAKSSMAEGFLQTHKRVDELGQVFMRDTTKVTFKVGVIDAK